MTSAQRREIIKLHKEGYSYREIAEMFGVNKNSVRVVVKGKEGTGNEIKGNVRSSVD